MLPTCLCCSFNPALDIEICYQKESATSSSFYAIGSIKRQDTVGISFLLHCTRRNGALWPQAFGPKALAAFQPSWQKAGKWKDYGDRFNLWFLEGCCRSGLKHLCSYLLWIIRIYRVLWIWHLISGLYSLAFFFLHWFPSLGWQPHHACKLLHMYFLLCSLVKSCEVAIDGTLVSAIICVQHFSRWSYTTLIWGSRFNFGQFLKDPFTYSFWSEVSVTWTMP